MFQSAIDFIVIDDRDSGDNLQMVLAYPISCLYDPLGPREEYCKIKGHAIVHVEQFQQAALVNHANRWLLELRKDGFIQDAKAWQTSDPGKVVRTISQENHQLLHELTNGMLVGQQVNLSVGRQQVILLEIHTDDVLSLGRLQVIQMDYFLEVRDDIPQMHFCKLDLNRPGFQELDDILFFPEKFVVGERTIVALSRTEAGGFQIDYDMAVYLSTIADTWLDIYRRLTEPGSQK